MVRTLPNRIVKYVLAGDSSGAVHALRAVDTAAVGTERSLAKTGRQAETTGVKMDSLGKHVGGLKGHLSGTAGMLGLGGLAFGLKDAVQAGMKLQTAQSQLQDSLRATGQQSQSTREQITAAVEASATHGGFDAPTQLQGVTRFITETHSASQALKANAAVTAVARKLNVDYGTALSIVARAQVGQTGKLQQYLGIIQPVTTHVQALRDGLKAQNVQTAQQNQLWKAAHPHMRLLAQAHATVSAQALADAKAQDKLATAQMVNDRITRTLGGSTAAYGKTTQGAITNAKNAYEGLSAQLGMAFLPEIKAVAQEMGVVAGWMSKHKTLSIVVLSAFTAITGAFVAMKVATMAHATATEFWALTFGRSSATVAGEAATAAAAVTTADTEMAAANKGMLPEIRAAAAAVAPYAAAIVAVAAAQKTIQKLTGGDLSAGRGESTTPGKKGNANALAMADLHKQWMAGHHHHGGASHMPQLSGSSPIAPSGHVEAGHSTHQQKTVIQLDSRVLAEAVTRYQLKMAARK